MTLQSTTVQPASFTAARGPKMKRDGKGVLLLMINDRQGEPITFTAQDHTEFTEAFYRIAQESDTSVVILTGSGGCLAQVDFSTFATSATLTSGIRSTTKSCRTSRTSPTSACR